MAYFMVTWAAYAVFAARPLNAINTFPWYVFGVLRFWKGFQRETFY